MIFCLWGRPNATAFIAFKCFLWQVLLFLGNPSGLAVQSVSQVSAKRLQIWLRRHHAYMAPIIWYGGCSYTHCNCHKCTRGMPRLQQQAAAAAGSRLAQVPEKSRREEEDHTVSPCAEAIKYPSQQGNLQDTKTKKWKRITNSAVKKKWKLLKNCWCITGR